MRPRQFTDEEMIEAARKCFLEHGPGVPTASIAAALGVSEAALYKRVGNKNELLRRALATPIYPEWFALVEAGPDNRPVREQLLELVGEMERFFAKMVPLMTMLRNSGVTLPGFDRGVDDPPPVRGHRLLTGWFRRLHAQERATVNAPEAIAMVLVSSIMSRHGLRHMLGESAPTGGSHYLEEVVDLICLGIAVRDVSTNRHESGVSAV